MKLLCNRRNCRGEMKKGKAIVETVVDGIPDFIGDKNNNLVTISAGGPGTLITCYKCRKCGYSEHLYSRRST